MLKRPSSRVWAAGCSPLSAAHALLATTCLAIVSLWSLVLADLYVLG